MSTRHFLDISHYKREEILSFLSGRTHLVLTACLAGTKNAVETRLYTSKITFKKLTRERIEEYLKKENVLDAAGAYKIQGKGLSLVKKIKSSYHNIMGLPLEFIIRYQR